MTPSSGDENPYQPPKVPLKASQELPCIRCPVSTVLVTLVTTCWGSFVLLMSCLQLNEKGIHLWLSELMSKPIALIMISKAIVCAAVMLLARRSLLAYYVGAFTTLLWLLLAMLLIYPMYPPRSISEFLTCLGLFTVVGSPFYLLFHRFTFGLPSRRYYGLVSDDMPVSETQGSEA